MIRVELPLPLQAQLREEALRAWPHECCGLVEGIVEGLRARVTALHAMRNIAAEPNRFDIDPAQQFALLHELRGTQRGIIGCYHSHPNGRAEPSESDRASAAEQGFLWLICAVTAGGKTNSIAGFVSGGNLFQQVSIVHALPHSRAPHREAGMNPGGPGRALLDRFAAPLL